MTKSHIEQINEPPQTLWTVEVVHLDTGLVLLSRPCTTPKLGRIVASDRFWRDSRVSVVAMRRVEGAGVQS